MVTRRNRVTPDGAGIRAPQADTFRALNAPMIPATRRTGVGDNAARLASALQGFSATLGSALGPMARDQAKDDKAFEKDLEASQAYNRLAKTPGDNSDAEVRDVVGFELGEDLNARRAKNYADLKVNVLQEQDTKLLGWTEGLVAGGGYILDEEGEPVLDSKGEKVFWTDERLQQRRAALIAQSQDDYDPRTVEGRQSRAALRALYDQDYQRNVDALRKLWGEKKQLDYKTNAGVFHQEFLQKAMAEGVPPEQLYSLAEEYDATTVSNRFFNVQKFGVSGYMKPVERAKVMLDSWAKIPIQSVEQAEYLKKVIDSAKVDKAHVLKEHGSLRGRAKVLYKQAEDFIALQEHLAAKKAVTDRNVGLLEKGVRVDNLPEVDFKKQYGTPGFTGLDYTPSVSHQEQKDSALKALEMKLMQETEVDPTGKAGRQVTETDRIARLLTGFYRTGETPPILANITEGYMPRASSPDTLDPETERVLEVVRAARASGTSSMLPELFKGNKKSLDFLYALESFQRVHPDRSLAEFAFNHQQNQVSAANALSIGRYKDAWDTFRKQNVDKSSSTIDATTLNTLREQAQIYATVANPSKSQFKEFLDNLVKSTEERYMTIGGYKTNIPPSVVDGVALKDNIEVLRSNWETHIKADDGWVRRNLPEAVWKNFSNSNIKWVFNPSTESFTWYDMSKNNGTLVRDSDGVAVNLPVQKIAELASHLITRNRGQAKIDQANAVAPPEDKSGRFAQNPRRRKQEEADIGSGVFAPNPRRK